MRPRVDSSWIDVVVGDNSTFVVRDHGQLRHVVSKLPDPGHQYPMLSIFIGRREKDITLQFSSRIIIFGEAGQPRASVFERIY